MPKPPASSSGRGRPPRPAAGRANARRGRRGRAIARARGRRGSGGRPTPTSSRRRAGAAWPARAPVACATPAGATPPRRSGPPRPRAGALGARGVDRRGRGPGRGRGAVGRGRSARRERRRAPGPDDADARPTRPSGKAVSARSLEKAEQRLRDASRAFKRERFEEARKILRPLADAAPTAESVRELLGLTYYRLGRWKAAAAELEAFRDLSGSTEQHPVLADCYRALGPPRQGRRAVGGAAGGLAERRPRGRGPHRRRRLAGRPGPAARTPSGCSSAAKMPTKRPARAPPPRRPTRWPTSTSGPATCPRARQLFGGGRGRRPRPRRRHRPPPRPALSVDPAARSRQARRWLRSSDAAVDGGDAACRSRSPGHARTRASGGARAGSRARRLRRWRRGESVCTSRRIASARAASSGPRSMPSTNDLSILRMSIGKRCR